MFDIGFNNSKNRKDNRDSNLNKENTHLYPLIKKISEIKEATFQSYNLLIL